jgi:hypothetical protein
MHHTERFRGGDQVAANVIRTRAYRDKSAFGGLYKARCHAPARIREGKEMEVFQLMFPLNIPASIASVVEGFIPQEALKLLRRHHPQIAVMVDSLLDHDAYVRWEDRFTNIVVNEGLDDVLDVYLDLQAAVAGWYVGLLAASPTPLATWTATQIATNDFVSYDEAVLQTLTLGAASGQSIDNVGNEANFTISADTSSIGGAFVISTNAKATPAGTLYSAGAFTGGNKAADDNDTLEVTYTATSADDGA